MSMLNDAGIYVIQDLSNPSSSINRNDPSWTTELYADYAAVIEYVDSLLSSYVLPLVFCSSRNVQLLPCARLLRYAC
jgi:hypothetical protein